MPSPYDNVYQTPPIVNPAAGNRWVPPSTGASSTAQDEYYRRMIENMPSRRSEALGDMGSVLSSFGSDQRSNRVVQGNFQGDYDRMMLEREAARNRTGIDAAADRRDAEGSAIQRMMLGDYLKQGGLGGGSLAHITPVSAEQRAAGGQLSADMIKRMADIGQQPGSFTPDYSFQPMDPSQYAKPGRMENISRYGGAVLGGLGALDSLTGGRSGDYLGGLLGKIPGLSRFFGAGGSAGASGLSASEAATAAAYGGNSAGAAAGSRLAGMLGRFGGGGAGAALGTYGLLRNRGMGTNIMNGATAGAGYGTMIAPGIGTLIGGGIGAGVGALRGQFGVSEKEKAARGEVAGAIEQIVAGATPQQRAEASQAGWSNPQQALANIVLRDKLGAQEGEAAMQGLFSASRG